MGRIEVYEARLDDVAFEACIRCTILYEVTFHDYCNLDTDCNKCPFNDSESIKKWLKEE